MAAAIAMTSMLSAHAQDPEARTSAEVIEGRQSNLRDLGSAYKELGDQLKKSKPMPFMVQQLVGQIRDFALQAPHWFPAGSGPGPGLDTKAKPDIWIRTAEFKTAMQRFDQESERLASVAATNDLDALKVQHRKLGEACKACHDPFREKKD